MNPIDDIAHLIQISVAPVFLLTGLGTVLNVLSGRLSRIVDRSRVLEDRFKGMEPSSQTTTLRELQILERRVHLIYRSITLSSIAGLMVCLLIASLFASAILRHSTRVIVSALFVSAMLASIASLIFFLREVFLAIQTFEIGIPRTTTEPAQNCGMHAAAAPE